MMQRELRELQACFHRHVLHSDTAMLDEITSDVRPDAATRLAIYANAYRLRLLEALDSDFSALHTLAGDTLFEQLGRAYIDTHPSTHYSVRYFGRNLSRFLAEFPPYNETPVLAEMAALEWALSLAFDAADDPLSSEVEVAELPAAAWPGLRLRFHDSVQRLDFRWNVPELWTAIDQQHAPEPPRATARPRPWLVWRRELQSYFRPLGAVEAYALDGFMAGADCASVCDALCDDLEPDQVGLQIASYLKSWLQAGLITAIKL